VRAEQDHLGVGGSRGQAAARGPEGIIVELAEKID
jgi:hypothetical protein